MKTYLRQLLLTVFFCQTAEHMAGMTGDTARRGIRILCRTVTLLTLLFPLTALVQQADSLFAQAAQLFQVPEPAADAMEVRLAPAAEGLFRYAERYGLRHPAANLVFQTETDGTVTEIRMLFPDGDSGAAARLTACLEQELGVEVHIFTQEPAETGEPDG